MCKDSITVFIILMIFVLPLEAQERRQPCPNQKDCPTKQVSERDKNFRRHPPRRETKKPLNILDPAVYIKKHIEDPHRFKMNLKAKKKQIELDLFLIRSQ